MQFDINTPKGQVSLQQEQEMLTRLENMYNQNNDFIIIQTPKAADAKVDGFWVRNKETVAMFESKCRNMTYEQLSKFGSWLITNTKLEEGIQLSQKFRVPFLGLLYLVPSNACLMWEITDRQGNANFEYEVRKTETQRTTNGGLIVRENAYLPVNYAVRLF